MKAQKFKVSEIPYSENVSLPSHNYGDMDLLFFNPESFEAYKQTFINVWGNIVLTEDKQNLGRFRARYRSNFTDWQKGFDRRKAESLKRYRTTE
jgi:hypothetical protein